MSFIFHPKVNELARSREVAEQVDSGFVTNWIQSGLSLSTPGSGLSVPVSNGKAFINGYIVTVSSESITVPNNATSTIYLGAHVNGQGDVQHFELSHTIPASGKYVVLGQAVASGGNVTSVSTTGRSATDRLIKTALIENDAVTTDKIINSAVTADKIGTDAVTTAKIQNDAVTFDKTQNIETARVLGRVSAGSGNIESLTNNQLLDFLGLPPSPQFKLKMAGQSVLNSTTLIDDTSLQVTLAANTTYNLIAHIWMTDGAGDIKYRFAVPSDCIYLLNINDANVNSGNTSSGLIENEFFLDTINADIVKTTSGYIVVRGQVKSTSSGILKLQFAQNTASGTSAAIIRAGSYIELTQTSDPIFSNKISTELLVVSGGGGGGGDSSGGGGGGGGGVFNINRDIYLGFNYALSIGGGGTGGNETDGQNGSSSTFGYNRTIGGGGGGLSSNNGLSGASGGGGGTNNRSGGTGTAGQGFAGGNGVLNYGGGGGGGGSAVGQNAPFAGGGSGGAGITTSITGVSTSYAGGGGGGSQYNKIGGLGGIGGGGRGSDYFVNNVTSGTTNTGGGGGGRGYTGVSLPAGSGGSGIIIIKYPSANTCTVGAGLTSTETTSGGFKIRTFTAGTGTISFT